MHVYDLVYRKFRCLCSCKKCLSFTSFTYFGYFGCAWSHSPKVIAASCGKLWWLSANQKLTCASIFSRDITLKRILWSNQSALTLEQECCQSEFAKENHELKESSFSMVFRKNKWHFKNSKYLTFEPFLPKFSVKWIFLKKQLWSLFSTYSPPTSYKKLEKIIDQFREKLSINEQTYGQMYGWTN